MQAPLFACVSEGSACAGAWFVTATEGGFTPESEVGDVHKATSCYSRPNGTTAKGGIEYIEAAFRGAYGLLVTQQSDLRAECYPTRPKLYAQASHWSIVTQSWVEQLLPVAQRPPTAHTWRRTASLPSRVQ